MEIKDRFYISLAKLIPKPYYNSFKEMTIFAGEENNTALYLGATTILSILIAVITILYTRYYTALSSIVIILLGLASFGMVHLLNYLLIYFKVEKRIEHVEKVLPDQLQLMSNNIKAGLTPFNALKLSARKEFGALSEEINNAINKSFGSNSFVKVLLEINSKIKSVMLERVLKLQASSLTTGNNMANLLDDLAKDIRETRMLRNDLVTKTKTYTAFILFTVLFGTPTLLSISIHFVTMISGFSAVSGAAPVTNAAFDVGFSSGAVAIQPAFLIMISYVMLVVTAVLASMLLGVIMKGKMTSGFKYAPALVAGVIAIFMFSRFFVSTFFGSMI